MRRRAVQFGLVVVAATAPVVASTGAAAATREAPSHIVLAPNHHVGAKPGGSGHGGGHGGGISWPGWASSNWSGYAVTSTTYTSAAGQWTVPTPAPTKSSTYSAAWVGIGGFSDASLIQTGTEQDFVNGRARYQAWWTTSDLGYAEQVIPTITVNPGDSVTASVSTRDNVTWTISLTVGGQPTFTKTVNFVSSELSAEWIMEAPGIGGRTAPIAHYGTDVFDPGTVNGNRTPAFTVADGGILIQKNSIVSIPSNPDGEADGFAIAFGSQQPDPNAT
jgi:hypothetical protein